jgi:hypothetical protein
MSAVQDVLPYQYLSHGPQPSGFLTPCLACIPEGTSKKQNKNKKTCKGETRGKIMTQREAEK